MRPYLVQIFKAYETPIPEDKTAVILSFAESFAHIVFLCAIRFTGKRRIFFTLCIGIFFCTFVISTYGFVILPKGYNSFDHSTNSFHLDNKVLALIPFTCLMLWSFLVNCGLVLLPFLLLSEIIPFK